MSTVLHKELALFDLDNTLIDTDSDYMWGEFLVKHHLVEESLYRAKNREFYEHYIAGTLDAVVYNEFVAGFLKQHTLAQLHEWREQYLQDEIAPKVRPKAVNAIQSHLQAVITPMTLSSCDFSLLILVARSGSFHNSGFSSSKLTSSKRSCLASMSKIPPKLVATVS